MSYRTAATVAAVLALAGSAQATFFSFASDSNHQLETFLGTAGSNGSFNINDRGPDNRFNLMVDDNNGPLAAFVQTVRFQADMKASWVSSPNIFGGVYQHIYSLTNGDAGYAFRFVDPVDGAVLLTAAFDTPNAPGVFSVPGGQNSWSSTGAALGSDSYSPLTYTATQALVNKMVAAGLNPEAYGVRAGNSIGTDDFGFDLTVLFQRGNGTTAVALDPTTRLPTQGWESEGSYSGSAFEGFIPTPGAAGLIALGGLFAARRRRSN